MNKNLTGWVVLGLIILAAGWFFWPTISQVISQITRPSIAIPSPSIIIGGGDTPTPVLEAQATAMVNRNLPVPTEEFAFIKANNLEGLQRYLDAKAQNWASVSQNVWSTDIAGVAPWSLINSSLGGTRTITWTAVWKGDAIGGLSAEFGLPTIILDENGWVEVSRTQSATQANLTNVEMQTTATVTFTGKVCVTSVEHWDFTPVHYGDYTQPEDGASLHTPSGDEWAYMLDPVNHHSYSLWTGESTTGLFPPNVSLDDHLYVKQMAEGSAKVIAHDNGKIEKLMALVETAVKPNGQFYTDQIMVNFSPEIASLYRVRGFNVIVNLTRLTDNLGRILRCDGTPVLR